MINRIVMLRRLALVLLGSVLLAGCGSDKPEALLASAKEYIAKNDSKAAIIQIKNALQKSPDLPEARYLLGKLLLENGEATAAEVELRKALELKVPMDDVVPMLLQARLALGQYSKLIEEAQQATLTSPGSKAAVKAVLASAYAAQGRLDEALKYVNAALVDNPNSVAALIMQARLRAVSNDIVGALGSVESAIAKAPANLEALKLKGDFLAIQNQLAPAIAAYRRAIEIRPDLVAAHAALVGLLLQQGNIEDVKLQLEVMKKVAPRHPQTMLSQAVVGFARQDYNGAREAAQLLLGLLPDNAVVLQIAGAAEYHLASYLLAENYLVRSIKIAPDLIPARRYLTLTYVVTGQPAKALAVLEPILGKIDGDSSLLALAGDLFSQMGDLTRGEEYLLKASKLDPKNPSKRTALALARFVKGDTDAAFSDLAQISASDPGIVADLALVNAHLRRGEFDLALTALDVIEKKKPKDPLTLNLRGRVELAKRDIPAARKSFEAALAGSPAFYPAAAALAGMDMVDKKPEDAKRRFEGVIAADPRSGVAMVSLAELKARAKAPAEEVIGLLNKAIAVNPTDPGHRAALVGYYLIGLKDSNKAIAVAQEAIAAIPESPEVFDALGKAQEASGDLNQALVTYGKLAAIQPSLTQPYMRMAEINTVSKNPSAAAQNLRKALEIKPDLISAQRGLAMLEARANRPKEAMKVAQLVQKQRPKEMAGYMLEGDILAERGMWVGASDAYRVGLKQAPTSTELALKLYSVLVAAAKQPEADRFAVGWFKDNPKDYAFRFSLGDMAGLRKDYTAAIGYYKSLLGTPAENAALFNNLAIATGKVNQPGALEYAEKAHKMAPDAAAMMDTLAMFLADKGDWERALDLLGKAARASPQSIEIRLNYIRVLIKANKIADARKELDQLAQLGYKSPVGAEMSNVLRELCLSDLGRQVCRSGVVGAVK